MPLRKNFQKNPGQSNVITVFLILPCGYRRFENISLYLIIKPLYVNIQYKIVFRETEYGAKRIK